MADDVTLSIGTEDGAVVATDDDGSRHHQYVKMEYGVADTQTPVAVDAPLPIGANTAKDGSGTLLVPLVDADGHFQVDILAITAGDNNIGNVDIVTLPSGNLGMRAMAASLSVTPASDITDGTYIGDIKFGEALPAGTALVGKFGIDQTTPGTTNAVALTAGSAAIGKLAANSGVDIGDVDVTSVVAGVGATNLGKARASALGATDTGVAALAVRNDDLGDLAGADGDYTPKQVDNRGALYVNQAAAEPKQASGVAAGGAPGTDNMIAAVSGKKILVLALSLFATATTTNTVYITNDDNNLLGSSGNGIALSLDADGDTVAGFVLPYNPGGWFKTDVVTEAVTLNTSAAQDIIYCITYIETD